MLSDRHEQDLAQILKAGLAGPSAGSEARALAALASIRPRRHPNLLTYIIVAALILLLAAGVFAAVRYIFYVEGTLRFHDVRYDRGTDRWAERARLFASELEWETEPDLTVWDGDISPDGTRVVHGEGGEWPPGPDSNGRILVSNLDGSDQINLTEIAGISGVNCIPTWSPDGTMIAFSHCDPVEGLLPCDVGQYLWVMNADGSDAHQVTPDGAPPILGSGSWAWSPDGSRLAACWRLITSEDEPLPGLERGAEDTPTGTHAFTTDIWGTDIRPLPNVGTEIAWSPDGSMLASITWPPGFDSDGRPGGGRQLLLTDADGSHPRVLVEQFITPADARAHRARHAGMHDGQSDAEYLGCFTSGVGPSHPVWSPNSDKIAFLAAIPFDPDGPYLKDQVEVWVYELTTDELIQITDDDVGQTNIIWK